MGRNAKKHRRPPVRRSGSDFGRIAVALWAVTVLLSAGIKWHCLYDWSRHRHFHVSVDALVADFLLLLMSIVFTIQWWRSRKRQR